MLDLRPGRTASSLYRRAMAAAPNGVYLTPPQPRVLVNLAAAKTVLSLGAPLLDGWIAPAEVFAVRDRFRLVQVEPVLSRTAALADEWLTEADAAKLARRLEGPVLVIDREMSPAVVGVEQGTRRLGKDDRAAGGRAGRTDRGCRRRVDPACCTSTNRIPGNTSRGR